MPGQKPARPPNNFTVWPETGGRWVLGVKAEDNVSAPLFIGSYGMAIDMGRIMRLFRRSDAGDIVLKPGFVLEPVEFAPMQARQAER